VIGQEHKLACRAAYDVTDGSGAVQVGKVPWLVQVLIMSQGSEQVVGQEQELSCRGACDVSSASGAVQVGKEIWFVQVLL